VLLLQIGDSHTANDAFSGHMRELLQARFGDAGRGLLPPGVPHRYYHPARVTVQSDGFKVVSAYHAGSHGPFGITGLRQHADKRAEMRLVTDAPGDAAIGWIEVLAQPGGGHLVLTADTGGSTEISTAGAGMPLFVKLPTIATTQAITVQARGDGPVDLLSWYVQRDAPGVLYDNLGTIGATIDLLGRFDPDIVKTELQHLQPALLLVAFGTNEGFNDTLDIDGYRRRYEQYVRALHEAAPQAGIVIVAPPDGVRARRPAEPDLSCATLVPGGSFATPPSLAPVRAAQADIAARNGWMLWNWQQAMAGPNSPDGRCMILPWSALDPPAAARDHVHLLEPGYRLTADDLFAALMRGYDRWRALKPGG